MKKTHFFRCVNVGIKMRRLILYGLNRTFVNCVLSNEGYTQKFHP